MADKNDQELIDTANRIEAVLFLTAEPLSFDKIKKNVKASRDMVKNSLKILEDRYKDTALDLIFVDDKYELSVIPQYASSLLEYQKEYIVRDLSPAALEVLSIIVFKGPIGKLEIEDLRGINSSQSLRRLKILGLIQESGTIDEAASGKKESEINPFYEITPRLIKHFGFKNIEDCRSWFNNKYKGGEKRKK